MKTRLYISFIVYALAISSSQSQSLIDVEIDSIHCQESDCYFINFTKDDVYRCYIYAAQQSGDKFSYVIDCGYDSKLNDSLKLKKTNILKLNKISDIKDFERWVSSLSFVHKYETHGLKIQEFYRSVDGNYGIIIKKKYDNRKDTMKTFHSNICQIIPVRVNNEYLIGGLKNIVDEDIDLFVIPTKNSLGLMFDYHGIYQQNNQSEIIDSTVYRRIFYHYKVRTKNNKLILTNSTSTSPLIDLEFDDIKIEYPYVVAQANHRYYIYNNKLEDITPGNLKAAYPHYGSIQIIVDDKIKWLDQKGNRLDSMPITKRIVCSTGTPCLEKRIINTKDTFNEVIIDCSFFNLNFEENQDTFQFNLNRNVSEIRYLSNEKVNKQELYCDYSFFCHQPNLYYFKTVNGIEGVFQHISEQSEQVNKIRKRPDLTFKEKNDLISNLNSQTKDSFRDEVIFEGVFDDFKIESYYQPIIFKKGELYGMYPLMKEAKYRYLSKLNGYLAEVIFLDGSKGWIDIYGNEIRMKDN